MNTLPIEQLRDFFDFSPETGSLTWKDRPHHYFKNGKKTGRIAVGSPAGTLNKKSGYVIVFLGGRCFQAHRIAWAISHGEWPHDHIDHINGIRDDNRLSNLRIASLQKNAMNKSIYRNNSSGRAGVHFEKSTGIWVAYIQKYRVRVKLGRFKDKSDAIAARNDAESSLFGEYSRISVVTEPC